MDTIQLEKEPRMKLFQFALDGIPNIEYPLAYISQNKNWTIHNFIRRFYASRRYEIGVENKWNFFGNIQMLIENARMFVWKRNGLEMYFLPNLLTSSRE